MSTTCSACRSKKIRCDGAVPVCGACTRSRIPVECSYTEILATKAPRCDLLQKGAACNACRKKKKKCDAKRPCSTCVAADKQAECQYKEDRRPRIRGILPIRTHGVHQGVLAERPEASADSSREMLDIFLISDFEVTGDPNSNPLGLSSPGSSTASSSGLTSFDLSAMLNFGNDAADTLLSPSHFTSPTMGGSDTSSNYSSTLSPNFVVNGTVDSNGLSAPYFSQSPCETPLLFRTVFLAHRAQLGLSLTQPKLDALQRGDVSGNIITPVLVHIAQLWGCYLCHRFNSEGTGIQAQRVLKIVNDYDAQPMSDPKTAIQAHCLMALYLLVKGDMYRGRECLLKASNVVMKYKLHIAESTMVASFDPGFVNGCPLLRMESEAEDEQLLTLCQLVYIDKCTNLVLSFPTLFTGDMDQELQILLKVNPSICISSFVVQRARSITYLQQARNLAMQWSLNHDTSLNGWYNKYWELLRSIHIHQADIRYAVLKSSLSSDRELSIVFKLCHTLSLTALAYLHDVLAPTHLQSQRSCFDTISEIVHTAESFTDEDYPFMDPVLSVCWTFSAEVLRREYQLHDMNLPKQMCITSLFAVLRKSAPKLKRVMPYVSDIPPL